MRTVLDRTVLQAVPLPFISEVSCRTLPERSVAARQLAAHFGVFGAVPATYECWAQVVGVVVRYRRARMALAKARYRCRHDAAANPDAAEQLRRCEMAVTNLRRRYVEMLRDLGFCVVRP